jgi:hypothetical protein
MDLDGFGHERRRNSKRDWNESFEYVGMVYLRLRFEDQEPVEAVEEEIA